MVGGILNKGNKGISDQSPYVDIWGGGILSKCIKQPIDKHLVKNVLFIKSQQWFIRSKSCQTDFISISDKAVSLECHEHNTDWFQQSTWQKLLWYPNGEKRLEKYRLSGFKAGWTTVSGEYLLMASGQHGGRSWALCPEALSYPLKIFNTFIKALDEGIERILTWNWEEQITTKASKLRV